MTILSPETILDIRTDKENLSRIRYWIRKSGVMRASTMIDETGRTWAELEGENASTADAQIMIEDVEEGPIIMPVSSAVPRVFLSHLSKEHSMLAAMRVEGGEIRLRPDGPLEFLPRVELQLNYEKPVS